MNFAHNLFLLMFNLSQLHNRPKIIELFVDGMNDAFSPLKFNYLPEKNSENDMEIKTRNSFFGSIGIENDSELSNESKSLIQNAVQMLAVILERLVLDENLNEEKLSIEKIAEERNVKLQQTVAELEQARKASLNLIEDLTEEIEKRKQSEKELKESEERFRSLFEMMAEGVVYQNETGEIISANQAAEEILGITMEQMLGRKSIDPGWKAVDKNNKELPGEEHPAMMALATGKPVEGFIQGIFNPKFNDYVWIIVNSIPQFEKNSGTPVRVFSTFLDITERVRAENELRKLKDNLQQEVEQKTQELRQRIAELERFQNATIEREFRIKELREELKLLKETKS
ncbi:MAG: PAS domain S-box protein [Bacteroidota bacterium]